MTEPTSEIMMVATAVMSEEDSRHFLGGLSAKERESETERFHCLRINTSGPHPAGEAPADMPIASCRPWLGLFGGKGHPVMNRFPKVGA